MSKFSKNDFFEYTYQLGPPLHVDRIAFAGGGLVPPVLNTRNSKLLHFQFCKESYAVYDKLSPQVLILQTVVYRIRHFAELKITQYTSLNSAYSRIRNNQY